MSEVAVHLVVGRYNDKDGAHNALVALESAYEGQLLSFLGAAVVHKDADGKITIDEAADMSGGKGATIGAVLGGVLGIIAGPAGVVVGGAAGAIVGSLTAGVFDPGVPNKRLRKIGKKLKPGDSAIVVLSETGWTDKVERLLARQGAKVKTRTLGGDVAELIEHEE